MAEKNTGFKSSFILGLVIVLPIVITILIIQFAISIIIKIIYFLFPFLPRLPYKSEVGIAILVFIFITWLVGYIINKSIKRKYKNYADALFMRIPVINKIYNAAKQVTESTFLTKQSFRRVVFVEYPRKGILSIGFVTKENIKLKNKRLVSIFIPNPPLPTAGNLIFVEEKEIIETNLTVEEALQIIVSGGILSKNSK